MLSGMAVSTSEQCDYEATLAARDEDGSYVVRAVSLQASSGSFPGLAGKQPLLRVGSETIRVESDPAERPPPPWTQWLSFPFFAIVPLGIWLNNRWIDRHHQSAQVRAFALSTPGIAEYTRPGAILRVRHEIHVSFDRATEPIIEVTLRDTGGQIACWHPPGLAPEPW